VQRCIGIAGSPVCAMRSRDLYVLDPDYAGTNVSGSIKMRALRGLKDSIGLCEGCILGVDGDTD